jgi:predicted nucleotidyltransferase component of viral defense system
MNNVIDTMLKKYNCNSVDDYTNAFKEIIQQVALLGLWRAKFFENAAFYGGTALRIFYGLNRFSEDLDFSLLKPDPRFTLDKYNEALMTELKSFGFETDIQAKTKKVNSIESVTIKANMIQLLTILAPANLSKSVHVEQKIKIKMEVDIDPPLLIRTESQILLNPIPFEVKLYQKPDLFATKDRKSVV